MQYSHTSGLIFMDDDAFSHTAKITKAFKREHDILSMNWSACSPNLNPIENIWNLLKNWLDACESHPSTKNEIKQAVVEEWDKITVKKIHKHIDSMSEQIQKIIGNLGGHTHW